jgi:TolB-like protein
MRKQVVCCFLVLFCFSFFYAQEEVKIKTDTGVSQQNKAKVLILPFTNKTDSKKFANSGLIKSVVFRSFYSFVGIIPSIDVPDQKILTNILIENMDAAKVADQQDADIIIYGNYKFSGSKSEPDVGITLNVWTKDKHTNIISKSYKTTSGLEIFDTIDEMIANSIKAALNIELNVANVNFNNFKIGREKYELYVNGKMIEEITNEGFSYNLKILPASDYRIFLKKKWDGQEALQALVNLKEYQSIEIQYSALGTVRIGGIAFKDNLKKYRIELDGKDVVEGQLISNVAAGIDHTLVLKGFDSNVISQETFYLRDKEIKEVQPKEKSTGFAHFKLYSLDRNMATLGAELYFFRYLWAGIGVGGSYFTTTNLNSMVFFISPYVEAGYYLLGDMGSDLRLGIGLEGRVNLYQPEDAVKKINAAFPNYQPNLGIFAQIEWKLFFFRPTLYLLMGADNQINFSYGLGAGIKL